MIQKAAVARSVAASRRSLRRSTGAPEPQPAERPARHLRGEHVQPAAHTCLVPGLDPTVPYTSAGGWKRRADALAKLADQAAEGES
jgi:hypothetical protein